jgi:1,4-alpha-glucan branching enzyme
MTPKQLSQHIDRLVSARHGDPFAFLGMHPEGPEAGLVVRVFLPQAKAITVVDAATGEPIAALKRLHAAGVFAGSVGGPRRQFHYRLLVDTGRETIEIEDPYRFSPILSDVDVFEIAEGDRHRLDTKLGAHAMTIDGVRGVGFAVWAPNAARVSVVGDFNDWDSRRHPMRFRLECGVWELFLPDVAEGALYKFEIATRKNELLTLKLDPFAFQCEQPPGNAGVVCDVRRHRWRDSAWMRDRAQTIARDAPISIYEVHLGSWRRHVERGHGYLTYAELAETLIPYVLDLGFTHIQLLPVTEHLIDGSWGYEPLGLFAPTSRFGRPSELQGFIDRCHAAGIGVLLDWVAGHFPTDAHGLGYFDGTCLYEHSDPRGGRDADRALIYNYGRYEVTDYLLNNALFWLDAYHIDGLRLDAVESMLYLDHSRRLGEWLPNPHGGNENLEAITFLRALNQTVYEHHADIATFAEENTSWPMVSRPTYLGGLGFAYKWNVRWMQDTLSYMSRDPIFRKHMHDRLTFGIMYAFNENFVLPLSHNGVVEGKGSLIRKMPGDRWQRFANLRVYFGFMFTHPGKKLLFMGGEFAQEREWDHNSSLDWHLLDDPLHIGVQNLVRDLNLAYRELTALHRRDCEADGFEWIDYTDVDKSIVSYIRRGDEPDDVCVVICNFTPVVREDYRIGVPIPGFYEERVNTDSAVYGGSGIGNAEGVQADPIACHGRANSIQLTLPPLAAILLTPRPAA